MLPKMMTFTIILGLVAAHSKTTNSISAHTDPERSLERSARSIGRLSTLICEFAESIIGYKLNSLSLAVSAIDWVISNIHTVAIGAAAVIGVCKLTNSCGFDKPVPKDQYIHYITAEQLDSAERFLVNAMEQYVERKRREV